jgi:hypothetical protein
MALRHTSLLGDPNIHTLSFSLQSSWRNEIPRAVPFPVYPIDYHYLNNLATNDRGMFKFLLSEILMVNELIYIRSNV